MSHWVYEFVDTDLNICYLSTRKSTKPGAYTARSTVTNQLSKARLFNTKAAAKNAGDRLGELGYPIEVEVRIKE